jgi:hypothetical protein
LNLKVEGEPMTRRLEAGPLLVTVGAVLLLVSLFLHWFTGEITAWAAFEVWDVVLFVLALGAIAAGLGLSATGSEASDRGWLPAAVAAVAIIVASQIIDPPPAAADQDADTGAWLALGSALVMCVGAVLTFGRVHLALTVEGREPRQHVSAVDARGPQDPTTDSHEAVREASGGRLFGRERAAEREEEAAEPAPSAVAAPENATEAFDPAAGDRAPEEKQD